tara:strand:- start:26700 stop:28970 length:2271 start_codon:yes stop_codon:yes gene_type:complete
VSKNKKNKIVFHDHISVGEKCMPKNFRFQDAQIVGEDGKSTNGIYVTVRASHAGRITGNNGLYLPSKMKDGAKSMVAPYEKPVGLHHLPLADPVGRIKRADYISLSLPLREYAGIGRLSDDTSFDDQVDIITKLAETGLLLDESFAGLGYILSTAAITDSDAVQKIRDGRYQTVSITANTDHAVCSVCSTDWADSRCEHTPGEIVDGVPMFLIAGELDYDGWDWVNRPADTLASVVSIMDSKEDATEIIDSIGEIKSQSYEIAISDSIDTGISLIRNDNNSNIIDLSKVPSGIKILSVDAESKTIRIMTTPDDSDGHTHIAVVDENGDGRTVKGNSMNYNHEHTVEQWNVTPVVYEDYLSKHDLIEDTAVIDSNIDHDKIEKNISEDQVNINDILEKVFTADASKVEDAQHQFELTDKECDALYDAMAELIDEKDAKLSTEKRKALPKSAFCGPERSFPVPDCAHVTAARRLINRYKGPGDKNTIMACVDRKAKSLGCANSDSIDDVHDETAQDNNLFVIDSNSDDDKFGLKFADDCHDAHVKTLYSLTEQEMLKRNLKVNIYSDKINALEDEALSFKTELDNRNDQLTVLRDELKLAWSESTQYNEARFESVEQLRGVLLDSMDLMSRLVNNSGIDRQTYAELAIDSLIEKHGSMNKELNTDDLCLKLHDGTTAITDSDIIDDPTAVEEEANTNVAASITTAEDGLSESERQIYDALKQTLDSRGKIAAMRHLHQLIRSGIINSDSDIKTILEQE